MHADVQRPYKNVYLIRKKVLELSILLGTNNRSECKLQQKEFEKPMKLLQIYEYPFVVFPGLFPIQISPKDQADSHSSSKQRLLALM